VSVKKEQGITSDLISEIVNNGTTEFATLFKKLNSYPFFTSVSFNYFIFYAPQVFTYKRSLPPLLNEKKGTG
jgi:hypothetical protein